MSSVGTLPSPASILLASSKYLGHSVNKFVNSSRSKSATSKSAISLPPSTLPLVASSDACAARRACVLNSVLSSNPALAALIRALFSKSSISSSIAATNLCIGVRGEPGACTSKSRSSLLIILSRSRSAICAGLNPSCLNSSFGLTAVSSKTVLAS